MAKEIQVEAKPTDTKKKNNKKQKEKEQEEKDSKDSFIVNSRYKLVKCLGRGSYGIVCSAIDTHTVDKPIIAIKKVAKIFENEILLKRAIRELKLMKHFNGHRNIISLIDLALRHNKDNADGLYCFQELCELDLARVIYSGNQFSEFHVQSFIYQILCGVKYLHSADVIHRDLKPNNILVTIQGELKICDFGLARGINPKFYKSRMYSQIITSYVATRYYRAPELLFKKTNYDKSIDLWSVGCILAEFYGRRPIFMGKNELDQINAICQILGTPSSRLVTTNKWDLNVLRLHYESKNFQMLYPFASNLGIDLITSLLTWNPSLRLDVTSALNHPFLLSVRKLENEPICNNVFDFSFEYQYVSHEELKRKLKSEVANFKIDRLG